MTSSHHHLYHQIDTINPQIPLLIQSLTSNPYQYNTHLQLIHILQELLLRGDDNGDDDNGLKQYIWKLCVEAFGSFSEVYPLNQALWTQYLALYSMEEYLGTGETTTTAATAETTTTTTTTASGNNNHTGTNTHIIIKAKITQWNLLNKAIREYFMIDLEIMRLEVLRWLHAENVTLYDDMKHLPSLKETWLDCLERCGADFWSGCNLWKVFFSSREFSSAASSSLSGDSDAMNDDDDDNDEKNTTSSTSNITKVLFSEQEQRELFHRALLLPIKDVDAIWNLYWKWESNETEKQKSRDHLLKAHLDRLQLVKRLERECAQKIEKYLAQNQQDNPKLVALFEKFVRLLKNDNQPQEAIYALYKRATTVCPLTDKLWEEFVDYMWTKILHQSPPPPPQDAAVTSSLYTGENLESICVNSVRNCYWNATLWTRRMAALERNLQGATHNSSSSPTFTYTDYLQQKQQMEQPFQLAQTLGLSDADSYFTLFVWYACFLRNCFDRLSESDNNLQKELIQVASDLRNTLRECSDYLQSYFPDSECSKEFRCLWAKIEARKFGDAKQMVSIMNSLVEQYPQDRSVWNLYLNLQREAGDSSALFSLLKQALQQFTDGAKSLDIVREWAQDFLLEYASLTQRVLWSTLLEKRSHELKMEMRQRDKEKKAEKKKKKANSAEAKDKQSSRQYKKNGADTKKQQNRKRKRDSSPTQSRKRPKTAPKEQDGKTDSESASVPPIGPTIPDSKKEQSAVIGPEIPSSKPSSPIGPAMPPSKQKSSSQTPQKPAVIGPEIPSSKPVGPEIPASKSKPKKEKSPAQKEEHDDTLTVFMWKIPYSMKQRDVNQYFIDKGCNVKSTKLLRTKDKKSKGQAYIRMLDEESVQKALSLDRDVIRKMMIRVAKAGDKEKYRKSRANNSKKGSFNAKKSKQGSAGKKSDSSAGVSVYQHPIPKINLEVKSANNNESKDSSNNKAPHEETAPTRQENGSGSAADDKSSDTASATHQPLTNADFKKFLY